MPKEWLETLVEVGGKGQCRYLTLDVDAWRFYHDPIKPGDLVAVGEYGIYRVGGIGPPAIGCALGVKRVTDDD